MPQTKTEKNMPRLMYLILPIVVVSCAKSMEPIDQPFKQSDPVKIMQKAVLLNITSPNLIYEEIFEGYGPFFYPGSIQTSTPYGFTVVSSPVYQGNKSARFELHDTDPMVSSGTRAEAKYPPLTNKNRWYSFVVYFPSANYKYDSKPEVISQWHMGGGVNPPISLITKADHLYIQINSAPDSKSLYELEVIPKDTWQSFVFHINHQSTTSGQVEIWKNGKKIFSKTGKNSYDFDRYDNPSWKIGLYKWEWNGTKNTDVTKRVIYFDNVREGNENASYDDMVIKASNDLNPPATIENFTLIDAESEKGLFIINDGAAISLSGLSTKKLSIKANPGTPAGSIKFVLSGPQERVAKDNAEPFTLMGDRDGNYYFGCWGPPVPGTYKLTAYPFSGSDCTGLSGIPLTVHFTFVK